MPTALFRLVALAGLCLMPTTTVYSDTSDGSIYSSSATLSNAQNGTGSISASAVNTELDAGQDVDGSTYELRESFASFDLAAAGIPAGATITAVALSLYVTSFGADDGDYDLEARTSNWGATVTTADWIATGSLSGKTLLATLNTSGLGTGAYADLTESGSALRTACTNALAGDGKVYVLFCTSDMTAGNTPGALANDVINFSSADESGTSQDPKLVVTYTVTSGARTVVVRQAVKRASFY